MTQRIAKIDREAGRKSSVFEAKGFHLSTTFGAKKFADHSRFGEAVSRFENTIAAFFHLIENPGIDTFHQFSGAH